MVNREALQNSEILSLLAWTPSKEVCDVERREWKGNQIWQGSACQDDDI